MKRKILPISLATIALLLTGCNVFGQEQKSTFDSPTDIVVPTPTGGETVIIDPTETPVPTGEDGKVKLSGTYKDVAKASLFSNRLDYTPTLGTCNILVIPIWFTDSSNYISSRNNVLSDIETAYFGSESETGWHSVKTFYETESFGQLEFNGVVSDWFECGMSSSAFYSEGSGGDNTMTLVTQATNWYFSNNPSQTRKMFDNDDDGYLDGVMLIYGSPDSEALPSAGSNMWAYCYWLAPTSGANYANPVPNCFFWASYDFMYDSSTSYARTGRSSYGTGNCSYCNVDAHTFIHEMGHAFGLDDYYDYGRNGYCFASGFSMQDRNVGGHDPFSLMAYGWVDPIIPKQSTTITISAFQKNHDVILLTPSWNQYNSPFDEYLLLELYTPTGLNKFDCDHAYSSGSGKGATVPGIRVWHVDARIAYATTTQKVNYNGYVYDEPIYDINQLTSNPHLEDGRIYQTVAFNNSYMSDSFPCIMGSNYEEYNLLQLIRNNTSERLLTTNYFKNADLFKDGDSFSMNTFSRQFANARVLNSGLSLGWEFSVKISGTGNNAQATIKLTKQ